MRAVQTTTNVPDLGHNGVIMNSKELAGFYLTETAYAAQITVPRHTHRHACFCLILNGSYRELYPRKTLECRPSHLIFRPAEELHSDHFGNLGARCFIIEVETEWLANLSEHAVRLGEPVSFQSAPLTWLVKKVRNESQQTDDFSALTVEGLMFEIAAEVARLSFKSSKGQPRWLRQTNEILHENFARRLSLAEIAKSVGVHPVYLASVFRQHNHCSIGEYIRRLRIEFASEELSRTDAPLADIALAAGFAHQSHFTRTFKRLTGLTPAQYRSRVR